MTTVLDLMLAQYGVGAARPAGRLAAGLRRPGSVHAGLAGGDHRRSIGGCASRVAREFARNAEVTEGRSMIAMGAGTNHWFHSDTIYRTFLTLVLLCGCEGRNGGGWAHYVGPGEGAAADGLAVARVRARLGAAAAAPVRNAVVLPRDRPVALRGRPARATSPGRAAAACFEGKHVADLNALGARLGWLPSHPAFDRNPLDLVDEAERAGLDPAEHVVRELREGRLGFACEDPDAPENIPRVLTVWRANILGSSGKGHEYFLGTCSARRSPGCAPRRRPRGCGRPTSSGASRRRPGSSTC